MTTINRHIQFNRGPLDEYKTSSLVPKSGEPVTHPFNNAKFHETDDKQVITASMVSRIGTGSESVVNLNYNITNQFLQVYKVKISSLAVSTSWADQPLAGSSNTFFGVDGTWQTLTSEIVKSWNAYSVSTDIAIDYENADIYNYSHINPMVITADAPNQDIQLVPVLDNNRELKLKLKGDSARTASNVYINIFIYQPFIDLNVPVPITSPAIELLGESYYIGFGSSNFGQLGLGDYGQNYFEPRSLFYTNQFGMNKIIHNDNSNADVTPKPAIGKRHVILPYITPAQSNNFNSSVFEDGHPASQFYAAGDNQYGQIPNLSAAKVADYESVTLNQPTHVNRLGTNDYEIVNSSTPDSGVLKVVAKNHSTAFTTLRQDATDATKDIKSLYVMGENSYSQLGLGDDDDRSDPTLLPTFYKARNPTILGSGALVKDDLELTKSQSATGTGAGFYEGTYITDDGDYWNGKPVYRLDEAGHERDSTFAYAVFYDSTTFNWPSNPGWVMGILQFNSSTNALQITSYYYINSSTAETPPTNNWQWSGNGGTSVSQFVPSIEYISDGLSHLSVENVSMGHIHGILSGSNSVYCWGNNIYGQCGKSASTFSSVSRPSRVAQDSTGIDGVFTGSFHSFYLANSRTELYAFGKNEFGQLGLRHKNNISTPEPIQLSDPNAVSLDPFPANITVEFTNRTDADGNTINQIGFNESSARKYLLGRPVGSRGTQKYRFVDVPEDRALAFEGVPTSQVTGTNFKTCRQINGVDLNFYYGNIEITTDITAPITIHTCEDDVEIGGENILAPFFDDNYKFVDVKGGANHTVFLVEDEQQSKNIVFTCGNNSHGQLGAGDNVSRDYLHKLPGYWRSIAAGDDHTVLVSEDYGTYVMGDNSKGQLGLQDTNIKTVKSPTEVENVLTPVGTAEAYAGHETSIIISNPSSS